MHSLAWMKVPDKVGQNDTLHTLKMGFNAPLLIMKLCPRCEGSFHLRAYFAREAQSLDLSFLHLVRVKILLSLVERALGRKLWKSSELSPKPKARRFLNIMSKQADSKQTESKSSSEDDFVNPGLQRWEQIREDWVKVVPGRATKRKGEVRAKAVDVDDVIERIYSQNGNGTLRDPLPLGQMIDLLIDFWEADGLYD